MNITFLDVMEKAHYNQRSCVWATEVFKEPYNLVYSQPSDRQSQLLA